MKKFLKVLMAMMISLNLSACIKEDKDPIEERIQGMSLRDKAAMMIMPSIRYESYVSEKEYSYLTKLSDEYRNFISRNGFGGIILFGGNIEDPEQTKKLIADINAANSEGGHAGLLIGIDQEGGSIRRISYGTCLPGNMALGAIGNREDTLEYAALIGDELRDLGINTDFAPVTDVNTDPANPVIGIRSFSDDPALVSEMSEAFIEGLHSENVISCIKHYPGHGDTHADSHSELPVIDKSYEELLKCELLPFKAGIEADCDMIMTAHIQFPQIEKEKVNGEYLPATLSKALITDILRKDLGYDGVVITDSLNMDAIRKHFSRSDIIALSINAGVDILLMPANEKKPVSLYIRETETYISTICSLVREGKIPEERIDEAIRRILLLKQKYALLQDPQEEERSYDVASATHQEIGMRLSEKAITLLKNDDVLPFQNGDRVLVLVPYRSQYNSMVFTKKLLTEKGLLEKEEDLEIICLADGQDEKTIKKKILPLVKEYDRILFVSAFYEIADIEDSYSTAIDLILEEAKKQGKKTVLLSSQLPYDLARFECDAALACYYAAGIPVSTDISEDIIGIYPPNLIAALLVSYGDRPFCGKLPVAVPFLINEAGKYRYDEKILYERGSGITYE